MSQSRCVVRLLPLLLFIAALPGCGRFEFGFANPASGFLSAPGDVAFDLAIPPQADLDSLVVHLDGQPVPAASYVAARGMAHGMVTNVPEGTHRLEAWIQVPGRRARGPSTPAAWLGSWSAPSPSSARPWPSSRTDDTLYTETGFTLVALANPDECDILNQVECVLPFPSSRFEEPAATETGVRIAYGPNTLPVANRFLPDFSFVVGPALPTPFLQNDGFSPTVQVLMHFQQTPDAELSGAARILPETRTYDESGADRHSPTLLIEWDSGNRQIHWIENDSAVIDPTRVVTFLRPGRSLRPGKRYIVAIRGLVDDTGAAVEPEPVFKAIRDRAPSDLPAVEARRDELEPVLERLAELGVRREDLILAFAFQVMSDHSLTYEMLSMRDQAFAWRDQQATAGIQTFTVDDIKEVNPDCSDPDGLVWRVVTGTFQAPLFLDRDPFLENTELSNLMHDAAGLPTWSALTDAPYGIAIPCDAQAGPLPPLVIGHGLFGSGPGTLAGLDSADIVPPFVGGATNWAGLSTPDLQPGLFASFLFKVAGNPDEVPALADRLRQGQMNTLLLARMLQRGDFNVDPAFQTAQGQGVILPDDEIYYIGASLGGIMGNMFAALTPDVERLVMDVPAINFSLLLDRAAPFRDDFELVSNIVSGNDRMNFSIGLGLSHETWVRGESAGYATHITDDPLPGVPYAKKILMHVALHDHQVSNLGSQLAGATMRLPVHEASVMQDLAGMQGSSGPQDSAYIVYDTAAFDLSNPAHLPFLPPLVNDQVPPTVNGVGTSKCDPHNRLRVTPAAMDQIAAFLQPTGQIENFCSDDGVCNASAPNEFPFGIAVPCDPLS